MGEGRATGMRAGAGMGLTGARFGRVIDGAGDEVFLGCRGVNVGGDVLLVSAGTQDMRVCFANKNAVHCPISRCRC
jgi:hypothetical protein